MKLIQILTIQTIFLISQINTLQVTPLPRSTTETPETTETSELTRILRPLDHNNMVKTLKRALEIAERAPRYKRARRQSPQESDARALLTYLSQDTDYTQQVTSSPEGTPTKRSRDNDPDYCLPSSSTGVGHRTSLATMQRIVKLHLEGKSEKTIKAQYKWYNRKYLSDFTRCVEEGGSHTMKKEDIEKFVMSKFRDLRANRLPVKGYIIRALARRRAVETGAPWFRASKGWLDNFKRRNKIKSLKVTKTCSRPEMNRQPQIQQSIEQFRANFSRYSKFFRPRMIMNIDQTGIEYESSNRRTLEFSGTRDVYLRIDSLNKNTHTFTAQPIMTRDGRLVGKLTLCMQEPSDEFGPRVQSKISTLQRELGNVKVYASKSGKMTANLMTQWLDDVISPVLSEEAAPLNSTQNDGDGPEEYPPNFDQDDVACFDHLQTENLRDCVRQGFFSELLDLHDEDCLDAMDQVAHERCNRPKALLLADSWSGQSSSRMKQVFREWFLKPLTVPPATTGEIQPLDVGFFLQLKRFIRRLTEEALIADRVGEITSREGIINMMSLIYNQLQSSAYYDLWRYAWRHTDPSFSEDELANNPPANVNSIQFGFNADEACSVENCTEHVVMRCSHCGRTLCLTHFLNRTCLHTIDHDGGDLSNEVVFGPARPEDEVDMDDEVEFVLHDEIPQPPPSTTTSTHGPDPLMEQILGQCGCY